MGRRATGFKVRWRPDKRAWYVRFTLDGRRPDLCTGVRDRRAQSAAEREGREIYAKAVREGLQQRRPAGAPQGGLDWWLSAWVEQLDDVREATRALYDKYTGYWFTEFGNLSRFTSVAIEVYAKQRLKRVRGKSVRNELSAMRKFAEYLVQHGAIPELPVIPSLKASVNGKPYEHRRRTRAPELSPAECRKLIAALPIKSSREGWLIRARFGVMYETTLRPETLDKLTEGVNYSRGAKTLTVTAEDDKELYGREVPLTLKARRWLDSACTGASGRLLFGKHRYDPYIRKAAKKALGATDWRAEIFTGQHFRSAAITHYLEKPRGNLPAVQYLAGHKHSSTTGRYVRPSLRAAEKLIAGR